MRYAVTLHIDIVDPKTLTDYVKSFVPGEFRLRAEDVEAMTPREALIWLYDCGTSLPGTKIVDGQIAAVSTAAPLSPNPPFVLPGFTPW